MPCTNISEGIYYVPTCQQSRPSNLKGDGFVLVCACRSRSCYRFVTEVACELNVLAYMLRRALVCLNSGRGAENPEACVIEARPGSSRDVLLVAMRRPGDRVTDHGGGFRLTPDISKHPKCVLRTASNLPLGMTHDTKVSQGSAAVVKRHPGVCSVMYWLGPLHQPARPRNLLSLLCSRSCMCSE